MRVARHVEPVRALIALLAAFTVGHVMFLLLRSPIEAVDQASAVAILPLFLLPAVIAFVGLVRGSMPLIGAAGALCMFPAIMTGWRRSSRSPGSSLSPACRAHRCRLGASSCGGSRF